MTPVGQNMRHTKKILILLHYNGKVIMSHFI